LITLEVKQNVHLFGVKTKEVTPEPTPVVTEPEETKGDVAPAASKSLDPIFDLTSRLKQIFAPATQEG
jgi:hypothetical protein